MPLDGIVINALVHEFKQELINGKIDKIYQPLKDQLVLNVRNNGANHKLLLSASSDTPRAHITEKSFENPASPPMFCMLLRKHLSSGKIINVEQPEFERVINFSIESYNELGDLTIKTLVIEIMSRHSNIILINHNGKIIDSIKHVDATVSSVRLVLPGLMYSPPPPQEKLNPLISTKDEIIDRLSGVSEETKIDKAIVGSFSGISPLIGRELCYRAVNNTSPYMGEARPEGISKIADEMHKMFREIENKSFNPITIIDQTSVKVIDFSAVNIEQYGQNSTKEGPSICSVLDSYYSSRDTHNILGQRSTDLLKILNLNIERCKKKLSIQGEKMREVGDRDKFKIFGDLITANIYRIQQGMERVEVENFYDSSLLTVEIPLDPKLPPSKNAQKYFNKYSKAKSTEINVAEQIKLGTEELEYLESIYDSVVRADNLDIINEIKQELRDQGYLKKITLSKKKKDLPKASMPRHYKSSDGLDIYVGKNNIQNDYLTLKLAKSNDLWFHTKNIPGSHVIIKSGGAEEIPRNTIEQAAILSAFYSKGGASSRVPVDYTTIKNVKKPSGAKPGMVIYENYKTLYVTPDEDLVKSIESVE